VFDKTRVRRQEGGNLPVQPEKFRIDQELARAFSCENSTGGLPASSLTGFALERLNS
jgi:hypothetical protein